MVHDNNKWSRPDGNTIKSQLSPEQYRVTQQNGTEQPFNNAFYNHYEAGIYVDIMTGEPLFSSTSKFDAGCGWPSFFKPIDSQYIIEKSDLSHGMQRTEVRSKTGDSHLGHLFPDGPAPTGQRYCINSAALRFIPLQNLAQEGYAEYIPLFENEPKRAD
jgi:methionine-R-sulfoxide reductase